jgi:hypothetical protein
MYDGKEKRAAVPEAEMNIASAYDASVSEPAPNDQ